MALKVTVEELRVLAAWRFPSRLEAVLTTTIMWQLRRTAVKHSQRTLRITTEAAEAAVRLSGQLHPDLGDLIELTRQETEQAQRGLQIAQSALRQGTAQWADVIGDENIPELLTWCEQYNYSGDRENLREFILAVQER